MQKKQPKGAVPAPAPEPPKSETPVTESAPAEPAAPAPAEPVAPAPAEPVAPAPAEPVAPAPAEPVAPAPAEPAAPAPAEPAAPAPAESQGGGYVFNEKNEPVKPAEPVAPVFAEAPSGSQAPEAEGPKHYTADDLICDFSVPDGENYIVECKNLDKSYGNFQALHSVSFRIPKGGLVGLLGPNGSGKTTLIKLAMGMIQPTSGEILIDGMKPGSKTKAITAYLPDANYLCQWMTVEQQINYYADFFPDFRRDRADAMLNRLGITYKQKIKALSKGNKEKLGLILTMSRDAELYILDEPIAGVDPAAREFILDTILAQKPEDATIFLCTHLIADIQPILTHAIFLRNGTIALNARVDDVKQKTGKTLDELFREVFRW